MQQPHLVHGAPEEPSAAPAAAGTPSELEGDRSPLHAPSPVNDPALLPASAFPTSLPEPALGMGLSRREQGPRREHSPRLRNQQRLLTKGRHPREKGGPSGSSSRSHPALPNFSVLYLHQLCAFNTKFEAQSRSQHRASPSQASTEHPLATPSPLLLPPSTPEHTKQNLAFPPTTPTVITPQICLRLSENPNDPSPSCPPRSLYCHTRKRTPPAAVKLDFP